MDAKFGSSFLVITSSCSGSLGLVVLVVCVSPSYIHWTRCSFSCYSGRHNCLWCLITSSELKIPLEERKSKGQSTPRTLESLRADHQSFVSSGGDLNTAKDHNNVIEEQFFNIPLENVQSFNVNNTQSLYTLNLCRYVFPVFTLHLASTIVSGPCLVVP